MVNRKLLIAAGLTATAVGALFLGVGNVLYNQLLTRKAALSGTGGQRTEDILAGRPSPPPENNFLMRLAMKLAGVEDSHGAPPSPELQEDVRWYVDQNPQKLVAVSRGERIHADAFLRKKYSGVWIICMHGFSSCPRDLSPTVREFREWGWNVLVPHLCGHGDSESKFVSMGWLDRLDVVAWIEHLNREYSCPQIILYGGSMGGAAVMLTLGEPLPGNVICAVEDCGYSTLWDEYAHQAREFLRLGAFTRPALCALDAVTRLRAGFSLREASCVRQLKKCKTPTLFIHGDADHIVPFRMLQQVYDACPCEKEMLVVQGAGHGESQHREELYFGTIKRFCERYLE
ncbi:MAG: alpha/beta fold hydrolase [Oscillospiraceae bacterium]|nr:alpha/beta fold hydrolase [Oscillospiraceae bacterium]